MAAYPEFSEEANRARVKAGYKGGNIMKNPILHPAMTIVDGTEPEVKAKFLAKDVPSISVEDPWYGRRNK